MAKGVNFVLLSALAVFGFVSQTDAAISCCLDVMVAADVSGSVGDDSDNHVNMRAFTTALFVNLDIRPSKMKTGIIQFAERGATTLPLTDNKVDALKGAMEQYRDLGITTDIGSAVDAMVHAFKSSRARCKCRNVGILITDGVPTTGVTDWQDIVDNAQIASQDIHAGVKWIVVAVGDPSQETRNNLQLFASGPGNANVLEFGDWCDLMEEIFCIIQGCCHKGCSMYKYYYKY